MAASTLGGAAALIAQPAAPPAERAVGWSQPTPAARTLQAGDELDEEFTCLADADGLMTIAGFGSLLSERSARMTFPNLINYRQGKVCS